jgi:hypothetical protein
MAIFKANYVKRGKTAKAIAKAGIRYIQHRRGKDGQTITRTLFNNDGSMERHEAYRMIDEAKKGSLFYRFVLSPDPKQEDNNHDLDMRDIAMQTMLALEERVGQPILWVGAVHDDHAPHLHAHLIAVVPKKLSVKDFAALRQRTTEAALEQRRYLDLIRHHERERPYPLPPFARSSFNYHKTHSGSSVFLKTSNAGGWGRYEKTGAFRASGHDSAQKLSTCTCPRCQTVHVHNVRDPVHQCSCGLILRQRKQLRFQRKERAWERSL